MDSGLSSLIALLALGVSIFVMITASESVKKVRRTMTEKMEGLQLELATALANQDSEIQTLKDRLANSAKSSKVIQSSQTRKLDTLDGEVDYLSKSTTELRTEVRSISDKEPVIEGKKKKKKKAGA
jgi:hypothetical protein